MARPSHLRRINQRRIVTTLLRRGIATRADLAKATGMSQPTAGKIVDDLLAEKLLESVENGQAGHGEPRMGRPGQLLRLDRTTPRFLAIQLGVTNTRMALAPVSAPAVDEWSAQFPTARDAQTWVRSLGKATRQIDSHRVEAVLVSVPGVVDEKAAQVLLCPNLRWAQTVNIGQLIGQVLARPVCVVQEIRALALGHLAVEGEGGDFLLVDFGDGVGGAAVINGRLFESPIPLSGELGHTPVLGNRRSCGCGAIGCVETLVSRRGLLETFATQARGARSWEALIAHIARKGVQPWLATALDAVAVTIAGAINVLGIRRVVITGSLTELPPCVVQHVGDSVSRGAMWARFGTVECFGAPRRRTAGLVWAAIDRILLPDEEQPTAADAAP